MNIARLNPFLPRQVETRPSNLGKVLLFCEGPTEVYYFEYFAEIIRKSRNKYSHLDIESIPANGNAQRVLNFAEDFLKDETNVQKYLLYEKHLVFDCDAPSEIEKVIRDMLASTNGFALSLTNLMFETWLLMHFEQVEPAYSHSKKIIGERLSHVLGREYAKADPGLIRQIIGNGDTLRNAINHAHKLEERYTEQELAYDKDIHQMNPYTTVHLLMERILLEMSSVEEKFT
ncbi:RloB family protein [Paenibacillus sp. P96]|uniref:RloB family protein n=1 Tax=Paenibacillus zeirhizosphaerae TaxID=2987519 RepID=A0ABT9FPN8_9BACL|nr:RloB family protein [Paenibacillus sp. P96]MDP4096387.1 RloB family protein [Paenibacillus sp. P96]